MMHLHINQKHDDDESMMRPFYIMPCLSAERAKFYTNIRNVFTCTWLCTHLQIGVLNYEYFFLISVDSTEI